MGYLARGARYLYISARVCTVGSAHTKSRNLSWTNKCSGRRESGRGGGDQAKVLALDVDMVHVPGVPHGSSRARTAVSLLSIRRTL